MPQPSTSGQDWRVKALTEADAIRRGLDSMSLKIDNFVGLVAEDHGPDPQVAATKAELAEKIGRMVDKLQTLAQSLSGETPGRRVVR